MTRVSQPPETPLTPPRFSFGVALTLPSPRSNVLTRRASLLAELAELQQQNLELCLMLERYSTSGVSVGSLKMGQRAVIPHQRGFPARGRVPELLLAVPTHRTWWQGPGIITIIFLSPQVTSKLLSPPVQCLDLELLCPWGAR